MVIFATLGPVACCLASYLLPDDHPHPFNPIDEEAIRQRIDIGRGKIVIPDLAEKRGKMKISRKALPKDTKVRVVQEPEKAAA